MKAAATAYGMPLCALGLVRFLKQNGVQSIILTAAHSVMGTLLNRLCNKEGIPVINIVRNDQSIKALSSEAHAKFILNQESHVFDQEFDNTIQDVKPNMLVDLLGGDLSSNLFERMQVGSTFVSVGNISNEKISFKPYEILLSHKNIIFFYYLYSFLDVVPQDELQNYYKWIA
jgi:NADPH:quinone reductase-like Zn-dependent oxidoreductase